MGTLILILQWVGLILLLGVLQIFSIKSVNRIDDIKYYLLSCFTFVVIFFLVESMAGYTEYLMFLILFIILINTIQRKKVK